jgi:hypothetical protein
MTHSGTSAPRPSGFRVLRGVFLPLSGVLGVFLVEAAAEAALLLGVCGSRVASDAGKALSR